MNQLWTSLLKMSVDDFNKVVLAVVALIALFLGPFMQWRIAKRQVMIQEGIANRQIETQQQIAKRQAADNISTKRQVWIDELRKDAAEFLTLSARLEELRRPAPNLSPEDESKNFEEMAAANARASELGIRIKLRLNPLEAEHNRLVDLLGDLADVCGDPPENETPEQAKAAQAEFRAARDKVVGHLQTILKHEWERVKRGDI